VELVNIEDKRIDKLVPVKSGIIVVFPITASNVNNVVFCDSVFCFDKDFSDTLNIHIDEEYATIFKKGRSNTYHLVSEKVLGWGIGDPYVAFNKEKSLNEEKIIARVTGKYGNFFLRNCSIMEGESIIIDKEDFESFDKFFKSFNKRNKLSLKVEYLPYNASSLALSKTKMLDKNGVIDTPDGYMFVLKTLERTGNFELSIEKDHIFIPKFKNEWD